MQDPDEIHEDDFMTEEQMSSFEPGELPIEVPHED